MAIADKPAKVNIEGSCLQRFMILSPVESLCTVSGDDEDEDDLIFHEKGRMSIRDAVSKSVRIAIKTRINGARCKASIFHSDSSLCQEMAGCVFDYCDHRYAASIKKFNLGTANCPQQFQEALELFIQEAKSNEVVIYVTERPFFQPFMTFLYREQFRRNLKEATPGQIEKSFAFIVDVEDDLVIRIGSFYTQYENSYIKKGFGKDEEDDDMF